MQNRYHMLPDKTLGTRNGLHLFEPLGKKLPQTSQTLQAIINAICNLPKHDDEIL